MSKKQKRQVSGNAVNSTVPVETTAQTVITQRRFSGTTEFNPDYSHVKEGLKRIGILAGSFIAILIILSFILK
jgi:hypothetical protein